MSEQAPLKPPMSFSADLSGKRALVTGASSAGLGAHFAHTLARAGAEVVVAARRLELLQALVTEIGPAASAVRMDLSVEESIAAAVAAAGPIDILVNNAGVSSTAAVLDQGAADFDHVVGVNLRGSYLTAREVALGMRRRKAGGSIINVASILGLRQGGQVTTYAVSKAGLIQMTKQFALELARYDIRVNALAPGYVVTDLNRDVLESEMGEKMVRRIPARRFGRAEDLDGALLLLASDASRYMTGSVIPIDGGHLVSSL